MKKKILFIAAVVVFLSGAESSVRAADSDTLYTKIKVGLAGLVDAIASESSGTTDHVKRLNLAKQIAANLDAFTQQYYPRVLSAYPSSADTCVVGTLDQVVRCTNTTAQSTVNGEVVAMYSNDIALGRGD